VVPWLRALLVFGPGEPPVPFTVPLLDIEPAALPDEPDPPDEPPLLPLPLWARATVEQRVSATMMTIVFIVISDLTHSRTVLGGEPPTSH